MLKANSPKGASRNTAPTGQTRSSATTRNKSEPDLAKSTCSTSTRAAPADIRTCQHLATDWHGSPTQNPRVTSLSSRHCARQGARSRRVKESFRPGPGRPVPFPSKMMLVAPACAGSAAPRGVATRAINLAIGWHVLAARRSSSYSASSYAACFAGVRAAMPPCSAADRLWTQRGRLQPSRRCATQVQRV
jgi:hypothetical protein